VLVTDSTSGVDEYHTTATAIFWQRRLLSATGYTMLQFFANSKNFGGLLNPTAKTLQLFSYDSHKILVSTTLITFATAPSTLAINYPYSRLTTLGSNFASLYSNC
jgi:hypothetical protein